MRRSVVVGVGIIGVLGASGAALTLARGGAETAGGTPTGPIATGRAERRDLIVREDVAGTLGYEDHRDLVAAAAGTVTWLPREGSIVRRGGRLYRVDDQPVRLLYGRLPAWRTLTDGVEGADVEQLERNLAALGYTDDGEMVVDEEYDDDTAEAVEDWQEDVGETEDGAIELGEIVFLDGPRRVGSHEVGVGGPVAQGAVVAATTSTEQVVTVDLEATSQELAGQGDAVTVELPDGRTVRGRIRTVSSVAETDAGEEDAEPTIEVTIALRERAPGGFDQAPVEVGLESQAARDVVAVPVEALLALAEGGFALEVVEGGATRLTAVETGVHADGWVEVTGAGIEEGTEVVIAP